MDEQEEQREQIEITEETEQMKTIQETNENSQPRKDSILQRLIQKITSPFRSDKSEVERNEIDSSEKVEEEEQEEQKDQEKEKKPSVITRMLNKVIRPYSPRLPIKEKVVPGENVIDTAVINHYSQTQMLLGLVVFVFGLILFSTIDHFIFSLLMSFLGVLLFFTAYEIEEIYVTSDRLLVRRIGFIERILRIPSDEEHVIKHVVSYYIGRAPMNKILVLMGFVPLTILSDNDSSYIAILMALTSIAFFVIGLRIGKRAFTINFAGGHVVLLGLRKGVPKHLIESFTGVVVEKELL